VALREELPARDRDSRVRVKAAQQEALRLNNVHKVPALPAVLRDPRAMAPGQVAA